MNTLADKPVKTPQKKENLEQKEQEVQINERQLIDALYSHYGKPENITSEKLSIYRAYRSPAGYAVGDWCEGGWQRGRLSTYTEHKLLDKDGSDTGLTRNLIMGEGKGSWFFHTNGTHIRVIIGGKVDTIIEM